MNVKLGSQLKEALFHKIRAEIDSVYELDMAALHDTQHWMKMQNMGGTIYACPVCFIPCGKNTCRRCHHMLPCMRPYCRSFCKTDALNCEYCKK